MSSTINGIDVSHYQGTINWNSVKQAGKDFAFAKATEGTGTVDSKFSSNWSGMKSAGIIRGAYHFYRGSVDSGRQAENFLKTVKLEPGDLPPVIDIEITDGADTVALVNGLKNWLATVQEGCGMRPIIYTGPSFWNENMNAAFGDYPLWVAHYTSASSPTIPHGWSTWTFWQYSQSGSVSGVSGAVDLNRFNGSLDDLHAFIASSSAVNV